MENNWYMLNQAWNACEEAYKSKQFLREVTSLENVVFLGFSGLVDVDVDVFNSISSSTGRFGEIKVDGQEFLRKMKDWCNGNSGLVHHGALDQFVKNCIPTNFDKKAYMALREGKRVVFTGHGMGGAMAILATIWMLEMAKLTSQQRDSIMCVSFGFPLIGDEIFARSIRRENWADRFFHVVSWHDIFSRVLLAPILEVSASMESLLPYWQRKMMHNNDGTGSWVDVLDDVDMEEAMPVQMKSFVRTIMQHCTAVANYTSSANMCPDHPLRTALSPLLRLSPYRPFGRYVFCKSTSPEIGGGIWLENHEAILPLLLYGLQGLNTFRLEECISEQVGYGKTLHNSLANVVHLDKLWELPLSKSQHLPDLISIQMEILSLGFENVPARLSLRAAGEALRWQSKRLKETENNTFGKVKEAMAKLRMYRTDCLKAHQLSYYDRFKIQKSEDDFNANVQRLQLAGWFDEIIEMVEKHQLPDDFVKMPDMVQLGTEYRLLVEPLDIANYYRLGKNQDSGPYMKVGRPRRYRYLEKWLKESGYSYTPEITVEENLSFVKTPPLTQDSCMWALVEESMCQSQNTDGNHNEWTKEWGMLQERMAELIEAEKLCIDEFLGCKSSFRIWWQRSLTEDQRQNSILWLCFENCTFGSERAI